MTRKDSSIASIMEALDATGRIAELVEAKGDSITADEAREALEDLIASEPGAGALVRETFLAWPAERQEATIDTLAGRDDTARFTWSRLLFGIVEGPDGKARVSRNSPAADIGRHAQFPSASRPVHPAREQAPLPRTQRALP